MRLERWQEPAGLFTPGSESVAEAWPRSMAATAHPSTPVSLSLPVPLLMPGVLDTRPAGLRVIDLRDGARRGDAAGGLPAAARGGTVATADDVPGDETLWWDTTPRSAPERPPVMLDGVVDNRPSATLPVIDADVTLDLPGLARQLAPAVPAQPGPVVDGRVSATVTDAVALLGTHGPAPVGVPLPPPPPPGLEAPAGRRSSPYMRRSDLRRLEGRAARRGPSTTLSIPQVGIAGALGLATIAAPLTGSLSAPVKAGANALAETSSVSAALVAAPPQAAVAAPFPQISAPLNAVEQVSVVVDESTIASVPSSIAAPSVVLARVDRGGKVKAVLPGCDGVLSSAATRASNGQLPASALCTLWNRKERLRSDAAVDLAILNVAYRKQFGRDLCVADGYRTLAEQYRVKGLRGGYAATPGTSEHGWGMAIDLCGGSSVAGSATYTWLRANAPRLGWHNPDWARRGGSGPYEPWHWEYFKGGAGSGRND